jgi:AcrR family transcriptional regulator
VAPATAYTYFASKDHLLAEVLWRRFEASPPTRPGGLRARAGDRVRSATWAVHGRRSRLLAAACTTALLGAGPDVQALRVRIGAEIHARVAAALGPDPDPTVVLGLDLAYSGAMLVGRHGPHGLRGRPRFLAEVARLLLEGVR